MKKQDKGHKTKYVAWHKTLFLMLAACLLIIITLAGWRVDFFSIYDRTNTLFYSPVSHGSRLITEYIHSVEKTAVTDEYIISNGKIWSWEEQVSSSNAGMPSILPKYTHFINNGRKLIFRGGRISQDAIHLRVGNETFGRNSIALLSQPKIDIYKTLSGKRITLTVTKRNLLLCNRLALFPFTSWLPR